MSEEQETTIPGVYKPLCEGTFTHFLSATYGAYNGKYYTTAIGYRSAKEMREDGISREADHQTVRAYKATPISWPAEEEAPKAHKRVPVKNKIKWLRRFITAWDDQDVEDDVLFEALTELYDRFILDHNLPSQSADEVLWDLMCKEVPEYTFTCPRR